MAFPNGEEAYRRLKANLLSIKQEVDGNNFSDEQARQLFISAVEMETGKAKLTKMTYSSELPSHAPAHLRDESITIPNPFNVFFNGNSVKLEKSILKDGHTYVQLREFCKMANLDVVWLNPAYHMAFPPGGGLPEGTNITNPTFVYTKRVTKLHETNKTILGVEITKMYYQYKVSNKALNYAFNEEGLVIRDNGQETLVPLNYNPSYGRYYIEVEEFKEKILPHLVDISLQG